VPDVTLLLTLPWEEGLARAAERGGHDRLEREAAAFHARVAAAFASFAELAWQRAHPESGPVEVVDARGSEAEVAARIDGALGRRWPETFPLGSGSHA
jgi:dTMP kinase